MHCLLYVVLTWRFTKKSTHISIQGMSVRIAGIGPGERGEGFCALENGIVIRTSKYKIVSILQYVLTSSSTTPLVIASTAASCWLKDAASHGSRRKAPARGNMPALTWLNWIPTQSGRIWKRTCQVLFFSKSFTTPFPSENGSRYWIGLRREAGASSSWHWNKAVPFKHERWMPRDPLAVTAAERCTLARNNS